LQLEVLSVLLEFGKTLWKVHSKTFDDASLALEFPEKKVERSNFFGNFQILGISFYFQVEGSCDHPID
jgi:hypothetical protein